MSVQVHNVLDEGDLEQLTISGPIKDMLNSEMVVLVVEEAQKKIYIWKGENARVRRKFIAARKSQDLRGSLGLTFKVDIGTSESSINTSASITSSDLASKDRLV